MIGDHHELLDPGFIEENAKVIQQIIQDIIEQTAIH